MAYHSKKLAPPSSASFFPLFSSQDQGPVVKMPSHCHPQNPYNHADMLFHLKFRLLFISTSIFLIKNTQDTI